MQNDKVTVNGKSFEQQIFDKRVTDFNRDLEELQVKHKVIIVPIMAITKYGIIAQLEYADKDQVDKMLQENRIKEATNNPLVTKATV